MKACVCWSRATARLQPSFHSIYQPSMAIRQPSRYLLSFNRAERYPQDEDERSCSGICRTKQSNKPLQSSRSKLCSSRPLPKSFTSMLAFAVEDGGTSNPADSQHYSKELDLVIQSHAQIEGIMEKNHHSIHYAVEETVAKKLKEMESDTRTKRRENAELEKKAQHYMAEAQRLHRRVMHLEQMAMSLKEGLENATSAHQHGENVQEEGESSFVDTEQAGLVRLDCLVCEKEIATVVIWPCRHICLCSGCDAVTKSCPFCRSVKTTSVKVNLPLE